MTIEAWYMDDDTTSDQRLPHKQSPNKPHILIGVLHWSNIKGIEDPLLSEIRTTRNYNYSDIITVSPDKLPNYAVKIKSFYEEHLHVDEEIRFCVSGSGYFDVRDDHDQWIRIALSEGDLIILPEGIYHRFTCDSNDFIVAMRLFVGEPVWTPYNRDEINEENHQSRIKYKQAFISQ
eukprot:gene22077-28580_t